MPRPRPTPLSSLTAADLKALLAEKQIEELKSRQAQLEADLGRVEKELARLVKAAAVAKPDAKRAKRAAKPAKKRARKKAGAKKAPATGSIESVVIDLLKANGAPMAVPEILASIKKQELVKTKAADFAGVVRQSISKSSKIKRVRRGVYRA